MNDLNRDFYRRLFKNRTNPDGCNIRATFFVSHEWTDYAQVGGVVLLHAAPCSQRLS